MTIQEPSSSPASTSMPTAERVAQALRERIQSGVYPAATWLPSERAIATDLGAGRPSVREALAILRQDGLIEQATGGRPRVAATDAPARAGARAPRRAIAAVIPQPPSYVTAHALLGGMSCALVRSSPRYSVLVYDPSALADPDHGPARPEIEALTRAEHEGAAGIVIWSSLEPECITEMDRIQRCGAPIVFVDRAPAGYDHDFVGIDNRGGVMLAVEHLHALGHRRIAFLSHPDRIYPVVEREHGYLDGLHRHGMRPIPQMLFRAGRTIGVRADEALAQFMSLPHPPTAIVAVNDLHAFELLTAAAAHGIRVPQDLSVVGFDDVEQYSPGPAVLTTVRQPFAEMGRRAAELLLQRIAASVGSRTPRIHVVLGPTLTVRKTTAVPRRSRRAIQRNGAPSTGGAFTR